MPQTTAGLRILKDGARSPSDIVYVAEQESVLVGVGHGGAQRSDNLLRRGYDAEILLLYVLPAFQRRGVGVQLLASMARALATHGYHEATSWVARESVAARRFYARYGGQVVAEQEHIVATAVMMEFAYAWTDLGMLQRMTTADLPL
jgi:ribosomal protein S18 acetylase RimI-like enzyme